MEGFEMIIAMAVLIVGCLWLYKRRPEHGAPLRWPLVGMMPYWIMHHSHIYDWITEILNKCGGTFAFEGSSLFFSALFTSNPENVEYILKSKFTSFKKPPLFTNVFRDLLGHGILNVDGEPWALQRRAAVAEFNSLSSLNHAMHTVQESVAANLISVLDAACLDHRALNLEDVFQRVTFDNVCELVIGTQIGSLTTDVKGVPFARAFAEAIAATMLNLFFFFTPAFLRKFMQYLGVGIDVRLQRELNTIDGYVADIIFSRKKEFHSTKQKVSEGRADLLSIFMSARDQKGEMYSDKHLRDICFNFILAGRDTTSAALSWFFWLLLQHPRVERNILDEINGIFEQRSSLDPKELFRFNRDELKRMHYLHASLTETMRLYPPVPLDMKQAREDVVLPDGRILKEGVNVVYSIYSMGRMESVWGKDCREFKPERWLRNGCFVNESPYKFTVFNGGPRLCIGKDFAYMEMKCVAAAVLHRFRLRMVGPADGMMYKPGLTLYMKNGLHVTLHHREETSPKFDADE